MHDLVDFITEIRGTLDSVSNTWGRLFEKLLRSDHIDVSYFAAGIVAHIASEGKSFWDCSSVSWNDMISELGDAVLSWHVPETEMVAYRSFNPFYPLFSTSRPYQVQLWAVWAVHHVCSKNPKRYCSMIIKEEGVQILQCLLEYAELNPSVAEICSEILRIVEQEYPGFLVTPNEDN